MKDLTVVRPSGMILGRSLRAAFNAKTGYGILKLAEFGFSLDGEPGRTRREIRQRIRRVNPATQFLGRPYNEKIVTCSLVGPNGLLRGSR